MELTAAQVATAVGGRAVGPDVTLSGVATDSRSAKKGQLFVPLRAARDGHDFIEAALSAGASAYLTERQPLAGGATAIVVDDAAQALVRLARFARTQLGSVVVGITGSVGKTTTKDLVASLLSEDYRVFASPKSFNNSIGTPYTVLNAPASTEVLVLELGANAPGEIEQLCTIALPDIGVVTRVAPAHTLGFGSIDGVARAKAELVAALPASGTAVLNADDPRVAAMAGGSAAPVISFGRSPEADVRLVAVELGEDLRSTVEMATPWGSFSSQLNLRGEHQANNAAAAVAVAGALGTSTATMAEVLARVEVTGMRMQMRTAPDGLRVLDDSYNASPVAVEAALRALAAAPASRRVAVLGAMAELGPISGQEHRRAAALAAELGVEVIAVAAPEYGVGEVQDAREALDLLSNLGPGDIVLVKGSRQAGMDVLATELVQRSADARG